MGAVIDWARYMGIAILRSRGCSLGEIVRESGVAVNTVRKYLAEGGVPKYGPRPPRSSTLEAYKTYLNSMIEAARPEWIPGMVLCREIRAQGFQGCERLVSQYVTTPKPVVSEGPAGVFPLAQALETAAVEALHPPLHPGGRPHRTNRPPAA